jgi:Zn-dependent protease with chaperone function
MPACLAALLLALAPAAPAEEPAVTVREAQAIARKLLARSRLPDPGGVRLLHFAPGAAGEDLDGRSVTGVPAWTNGNSAGALAARLHPNLGERPVIYTTPNFYRYARTPSEAAGIMAHEIAHLELEHGRKFDAAFCALYREWKKKPDAPCPHTSKDYARFRKQAPWVKERLLGLDRQQEYEADERGLRLAAAAGYDARAYVKLMERAVAVRADPEYVDDGTHPHPEDRLRHLKATALPEAEADRSAF